MTENKLYNYQPVIDNSISAAPSGTGFDLTICIPSSDEITDGVIVKLIDPVTGAYLLKDEFIYKPREVELEAGLQARLIAHKNHGHFTIRINNEDLVEPIAPGQSYQCFVKFAAEEPPRWTCVCEDDDEFNDAWSDWFPATDNENEHMRYCKRCGRTETAYHTYLEEDTLDIIWEKGQTDPEYHKVTCSVCKKNIKELHNFQYADIFDVIDPDHNQKHIKTCLQCDYLIRENHFALETAPYEIDSDYHWKSCSCCSNKAFSIEPHFDMEQDNICDVCHASGENINFTEIETQFIVSEAGVLTDIIMGTNPHLEIPVSDENGVTITSIANNVLSFNEKIKSLSFAEGSQVAHIGELAFSYCSHLTTISLPNSLGSNSAIGEGLGAGVFCGCTKIVSISIPSTNSFFIVEDNLILDKDKSYIYLGHDGIQIPSSVKVIGKYAYAGLKDISLQITKNISAILDYAFDNCNTFTLDIEYTEKEWNSSVDLAENWKGSSISILIFQAEPSEGLVYNFIDSSTCSITGIGDCKDEHIIIPRIVPGFGHKVIAIEEAAFANTGISSVEIPNSIQSIGTRAFEKCLLLEKVQFKMGSECKEIKEFAFSECEKLVTVNFDLTGELTTIEDYAFYKCSSLRSITFPKKLSSITGYAVAYCDLRDGVFVHKDNAYFQEKNHCLCANDALIIGADKDIPLDITTINEAAYYGRFVLNTLNLNNTITIKPKAFYDCINLPSLTMTDSLTTIESEAFFNCEKILWIDVSKNLTSFETSVFENCKNLSMIYNVPVELSSFKAKTFASCPKLNTIIYAGYRKYWYFENTTDWPLGTTKEKGWDENSGDYMLTYEYTKQEPESKLIFQSNGDGTCSILGFSEAVENNVLILPWRSPDGDLVTSIGAGAFKNKTFLQKVILPEGLVIIGSQAFYGCAKMESIYFPPTVAVLEDYAFWGCSALKAIEFYTWNRLKTIGNHCFEYCSSIASCYFGDETKLKTIGQYAFAGCKSLTYLDFPVTLQIIDDYAFINCSALKELDMGYDNNIVCNDGIYIDLGCELETIGAAAFRNCYELETIYVSQNTKTIRGQAFKDCDKITTIRYGGVDEKDWELITLGSDALSDKEYSFEYRYSAPYAAAISGSDYNSYDATTGTWHVSVSTGAQCPAVYTSGNLSGLVTSCRFTGSDRTQTFIPKTVTSYWQHDSSDSFGTMRFSKGAKSTSLPKAKNRYTKIYYDKKSQIPLSLTQTDFEFYPLEGEEIIFPKKHNLFKSFNLQLKDPEKANNGYFNIKYIYAPASTLVFWNSIFGYDYALKYKGYKVETIELNLDPSISDQILGGTNSISSPVNSRPIVYLHDNNTPYIVASGSSHWEKLYLDSKESFRNWLNAPGDGSNEYGKYSIYIDDKQVTQILEEDFDKKDETGLRKGHFTGLRLDLLEIPSGVKVLPEYACRNATIQSILLPETLETISPYAFSYLSTSELTIPDSVIEIQDYAFNYASMSSFYISPTTSQLKKIGKEAFYKASFPMVYIPINVESIDSTSFQYTNIESLWYNSNKITAMSSPKDSSTWGNISDVYIGKDVERIPTNFFRKYSTNYTGPNLKNLYFEVDDTLKSKCTTFGNMSFDGYYWADSLEMIGIPDSVTKFENDVFGYMGAYSSTFYYPIYYQGAQEQWNAIQKDPSCFGSGELDKIVYNSTQGLIIPEPVPQMRLMSLRRNVNYSDVPQDERPFVNLEQHMIDYPNLYSPWSVGSIYNIIDTPKLIIDDAYANAKGEVILNGIFSSTEDELKWYQIQFSNGLVLTRGYPQQKNMISRQLSNISEDLTYNVVYMTKKGYLYETPYQYTIKAFKPEESTSEQVVLKDIKVDSNTMLGSIDVKVSFESITDNLVGHLLIERASSKSLFTNWERLRDLWMEMDPEEGNKEILIQDTFAEPGIPYQYRARFIWNDDMSYSNTIINENYTVSMPEDIYLTTDKMQMRIKYDPDVSSFKYNIAESVTPTIGGKYPVIKRNGMQKYATFTIGGLISYGAELYDYDMLEDAVKANDSIRFTDKNTSSEEGIIFTNSLFFNTDEKLDYNPAYYSHLSEEEQIIALEKLFREKVIDFLYADDVKLFKSTQEGMKFIKLSNISLTPKKELGRNIYSFSATATEVAECNMDSYHKYIMSDEDEQYYVYDYAVVAEKIYNQGLYVPVNTLIALENNQFALIVHKKPIKQTELAGG